MMIKLNEKQVLSKMYLKGIRTRRELAKRIGVSESYTYDLLRGAYGPNTETLFSLARVLDCPVEELVEEVEERTIADEVTA
jgi:transcriptional regulator with XRE-family HTH domain